VGIGLLVLELFCCGDCERFGRRFVRMNADTDWVGGQTYFRGLCMLAKVERGACSGLRADDFGLTRIVFGAGRNSSYNGVKTLRQPTAIAQGSFTTCRTHSKGS